MLTSFYGSMFSLGAILTGMVCIPYLIISGADASGLLMTLNSFILTGLVIEAVGHLFHLRYMRREESEAAASFYQLTTTFGKTYQARNILLGLCLVAVAILCITGLPSDWPGILLWTLLAGLIALTALVSRALFYVLVIPTTMPGAFFWKNKGFEEHARKTGLAKMPQVGVLQHDH